MIIIFPTKLDHVTCSYGVKGSWAAGYHTGIDYRAEVGTPVFAAKGGKVVHKGWGGYGSAYGYHVIIESVHRGKRVRHMYAHMHRSNLILGSHVKDGQRIGFSGNTGNTTGPHVHYEERTHPFGYYDHRRPQLPGYFPGKRKNGKRKVASKYRIKFTEMGRTYRRRQHIIRIQKELNKKLDKKLKLHGFWDKQTKEAYRDWQKKLGYTGRAADGYPGKGSLRQLGFKVL